MTPEIHYKKSAEEHRAWCLALAAWKVAESEAWHADTDCPPAPEYPTTPEIKADEEREAKFRLLRDEAKSCSHLRHSFGDEREFYVSGIEVYRRDIRVKYKPCNESDHWTPEVKPKREAITERSKKARKRLHWTVSNTETPIIGMIVLTYRDPPWSGKVVKRQLGDFFDLLRRRWAKKIEWLWWMEFQARGAVHIHILTSGSIHNEMQTRKVWRKKKERDGTLKRVERTIYCGAEYDWMADRWLRIIRAEFDARSRRWSAGGIWEVWDTPCGAARYASKDAYKNHQTRIPKNFQDCGAWWHRSRGFKTPVMLAEVIGGESAVRQVLKISEGKLFPVLFNATATLNRQKL